MAFDIKMVKAFYNNYASRVEAARIMLGRPMTLSEKILYAHGNGIGFLAGRTTGYPDTGRVAD